MAAAGGLPFATMAGRIAPPFLQALDRMDYKQMTPVQQKVLQLPAFDRDCLVQAKTGTGKTIAFLLPALQTLLAARDRSPAHVGLLVLAPTRELAQQIADECDKLTSLCRPPDGPRLECHVAVGGSNKKALLARFLRGRPSVLVATPGRLLDYLADDAARRKFARLRVVVLDEADRMLDQGFAPSLVRILQALPPKAQGAGWQGMCFSATMPPAMDKVLHLVLRPDHVRISTVEPGSEPTVDAIPQTVVDVPSIDEVLPVLHSLLAHEQQQQQQQQKSVGGGGGGGLKAVVFCSTARQAGLLYQLFAAPGGAAPARLSVFQMHSRMSQPARNRTVEEFKAAASGVLFASDVVGRGMDFPDIGLVVQVGLPSDKEQYVHRVGRTGRAGKLGRAVMVLIPEERRFVQKNPEFPIRNASLPDIEGTRSRQIIDQALANVPEAAKVQAYVSFLGFTKTLTKVHGLPAAGVVALANRYAASLGLASPPVLEAQTVGKMGLKGVPGLNVRSGGGGGGGGGGGRRGRGGGRGAGAGAGGGGGGGNGGGAPGGQPNKKRTFSKRD